MRDRIRAALEHEEGKIPVDFGSAMTTGIHISCVAELREYYGLEKKTLKVAECYQMLGEIEDDLKEAMGIDTVGVFPLTGMFGFKNEKYKEWRAPWGQEVLVPEKFEVSIDENRGGYLIYP